MPNEAQIRQMIKQEIQAAQAANRFQLAPLQRHIHNNIDSPYTQQPILTYIGIIGQGSATAPVTVNLLPKGWTVRYDGTGAYTILHNLGTTFYGMVANAVQSTNIYATPVITPFANEVSTSWANVATALSADTGFIFMLTVANNKSTVIPSYYGSYVK